MFLADRKVTANFRLARLSRFASLRPIYCYIHVMLYSIRCGSCPLLKLTAVQDPRHAAPGRPTRDTSCPSNPSVRASVHPFARTASVIYRLPYPNNCPLSYVHIATYTCVQKRAIGIALSISFEVHFSRIH